MKTQNETTTEIIKSEKRTIYNHIKNQKTNQIKYDNLTGNTLIELIADNATGEISEIGNKYKFASIDPTKDEAIAMTYEISNNQSKYLEAMNSHADECRNDALEVLREIYPTKGDAELKKMIG